MNDTPGTPAAAGEPQALAERYARRPADDRHSPLAPDVVRLLHARRLALLGLLAKAGIADPSQLQVLEVGCGSGGNLLELVQLGFSPSRLGGIELLPQRHAAARERLPAAVTLWLGDAVQAPIAPASQDLVMQFTVFSSLLDDGFQQQLAATMWRWLRPGGAVLSYDFVVGNPGNRDVRAVPLRRLRTLFPQGRMRSLATTLAPPLARAACRLHPGLYGWLHALPLLRTHRLAWITKPG